MSTRIRPNRLEVSDRFPMLGFTVRTDGDVKRFEIAIGTSPDLFGPEGKAQRSRSNFYSTRAAGPLPIERGEAVYVLPPEVLARFVGQAKLYYGLAAGSNGTASVATMPGPESPYINISGLTGRSLQRVRLLPNRQRAASNYGKNGTEMEWAGDLLTPGTQPATPVSGKAEEPKNGGSKASLTPYDDGYGPLPPPPAPAAKQPQAQSRSLADDDSVDTQDSLHGIAGPIPDDDAMAQGLADPTSAEYPQASRFAAAASVNYRAVSGARNIRQIVIHITDGGPKIGGTINWFQSPDQRNSKGEPIHVSAHYVIGQDGEVVQMVKHNDVAWHASQANSDGIGIEHVARSPRAFGKSDSGLMPTDAQYCASAALVNWLCDQFGIPMDRDHIRGHNEASPRDRHTDCPNAVWDWDYYMGLVTSGTCEPRTATASSLGAASQARLARKTSKPRSQALRQVDAGYTPTNTQEALQYQKEFQDRKQAWAAGVPDTTFFPHSATCALRMTTDEGLFSGTGFYIGDDRILTCGHNLAGASSVTIIPGKNGDTEPFGSFTASPADWVIHPKFDVTVARSSPTGHDFDLAVIKVSTPPPNEEAFRILEELLQCQDSPIIVCGYAAGTVDRNKQHLDGDAIRLLSDSGEVFMYNLQTEGGTSGSPVYYMVARDDEARQQCVLETHLIGVHVDFVPGSTILNEGCRLTADKIAWINSVGRPFSAVASAYSLGKNKKRHARALDEDLQPVQLPASKLLTGWQKTVLRTALDAALATPISPALPLLVQLVNQQGFSVGIGLGGDVGLLGGGGLGFGVILAPNNDVGVFGSVEISAGLLAGLSVNARVIVIHGGIEAFNETGYAMGVTLEPELEGVGIPVEGTVMALFNAQRQFHGVSFRLGIGEVLSPIQIFTATEKSVSAAITQSLAADDDGSTHGIEGPIPDGTAVGQSLALQSTLTPRWEPANRSNYTAVSGTRTISRIVIHITDGGPDVAKTIAYFKDPKSQCSVHYIIAQDGEVIQMVSNNNIAWHADGANADSISIDHVARQSRVRGQSDPGLPLTKTQLCVSAQLVNILCNQFNIPLDRDHIVGHEEADPTTKHKGCPTAVWNWDDYMQAVAIEMDDPSAACPNDPNIYVPIGSVGSARGQSLSLRLPAPPKRKRMAQARGLDEANSRMIANSPLNTLSGGEGNVTWELDQFPGAKMASVSAGSPMQSAEKIQLSNWPYYDHRNGRRAGAWFTIDWKFSGQALGQVRITPSGTQQGPYPLRVEARIEDGKDRDANTVSLLVRFTYRFSTAEGSEVVATTDLILYSDGSIDQRSNWMAQAAA